MDYKEWINQVPDTIRTDSLWKMTAYRIGLFVADVGWHDVLVLAKDRHTRSIADQLYRALCGISPTLAEGYSRGTGKDRARFYEYSLGSVRESKNWYFKSRHVLGSEVYEHRLSLLNHIQRLLLTMIPQQRGTLIREERSTYASSSEEVDGQLQSLLNDVPMPESD